MTKFTKIRPKTHRPTDPQTHTQTHTDPDSFQPNQDSDPASR